MTALPTFRARGLSHPPMLTRHLRHLCALVALAFLPTLGAAQRANGDPEKVRFVTDDLAHFWDAFDARAALGTGRALDSLYFARATPGLRDFRRLRLQKVEEFARTVDRAAAYYASTRPSMALIAALEPELRTMLRRFSREVPDAELPDVYFVVGRLSTGGTTGRSGLLIGAEMYGRTADSLLGPPLTAWHRAVLRPVEDLAGIVAHELVHIQQRGTGNTLLERSLREGIADFVGERMSGKNINAGAQAWADGLEAELWAEFRRDMLGEDVTRWLYDGNAAAGRPADLGYVMGYRIARAWFSRQPDERDALKRLLDIKGLTASRRLVDESGYAPR